MSKPLHILNRALPDFQSGYTIRSQSLLLAQKQVGLDPQAFVNPRHPVSRLNAASDGSTVGRFVHDGVTYHGCGHLSSSCRKSFAAAESTGKVGIRNRVPWKQEREIVDFLCNELDFDVIHAHTPCECYRFAEQVATMKSTPVVYEVRGFWHLSEEAEGMPPSRRHVAAGELEAAKRADAVTTLGNPMLQYLTDQGVDKNKIFLLPNGVFTEKDQVYQNSRRVETRARRGIRREFLCGCFTNVRRLEGLDTAISAMRILRDENFDVRLLILGDGAALGELRELVRQLDLSKEVMFLGRVARKDIDSFYDALDLYVLPRINAKGRTSLCRSRKTSSRMGNGQP